MNLSKLQEIEEDRGAWHAAGHGVAESDTIQQQQQGKFLVSPSEVASVSHRQLT